MSNPLLAVIFVFILSISALKYFEDRFCLACLASGRKIISIVIGATVVALFTELLDSVYLGIHSTNKLFVLILPLSFIIFIFLYRHIYKHKDNQEQSKELNTVVKTLTSFSDVLMGILAFTHIQSDLLSEIIFLGILLAYELIEQLSLHIIHEENGLKKPRSELRKIFLSLLPLFGFLYAYFIGVSETTSAVLLAIYGGTVFSVMVREIFSQERKILPYYFLTGASLFVILFLINVSIL